MKNKKGYTLVELIITLAVIGIMLTPIFNAFIESNRVNLRSRRQISAAYLAQKELEIIKGLTRAEFNALDQITGDLIDIDNDSWIYNHTETDEATTSNGGTTFDVNVTINNVTSELGIALTIPSGSSMTDERDHHVRVKLDDAILNTTISSTERVGATYNSDKQLDLLFTQFGSSLTQSTLSVDGETYGIVHSNIPSVWNDVIYVNVVGYEGLSDDWQINIINNSIYTIDAKPFDDVDGKIKITPDPTSISNIYIGNPLPLFSGSPSTSEEWYNVVITVSHNGTVYEVIESTVGK